MAIPFGNKLIPEIDIFIVQINPLHPEFEEREG